MKNFPTLLLVLILVVGAVLGRSFFPKTVEIGRNIPTIVTKHDTVHTTWTKHDTVKVEHFTTDTFNLIVRQTIYDTVVINVSDNKPDVWPLLSYRTINRDSAYVRTFDLRTGYGAASTIYTPGPLNTLVTGSFPTPNMTFGTYPSNHTSGLTKILYTGLGFGLCSATNWANRQLGNK